MKIKEYNEMMAYLTRPKDSLKEIFKNKKNKKPIDARTASLNKVSDTKVPPKNTLEQQIINKTKELSEDKITTKRPIVKDHFTKQLINANNTFDGGPYIVDNETGEVVSEAELKRRFTYQDKPYPKQATKKQMDELTTRVKKYVDNPSIGIDAVEQILDAAHALKYQMSREFNIKKLTQNFGVGKHHHKPSKPSE